VRDACFRKSADLISCLSCTYICDICCYQPKLQSTKNIFNIISFFSIFSDAVRPLWFWAWARDWDQMGFPRREDISHTRRARVRGVWRGPLSMDLPARWTWDLSAAQPLLFWWVVPIRIPTEVRLVTNSSPSLWDRLLIQVEKFLFDLILKGTSWSFSSEKRV